MKQLIKKAGESISDFCYNECMAYCCKKGTIPLTLKEIGFLKPTKLAQYIDRTSMILPCPRLIENKCTVHDSKGRPKVCKEFPLSIVEGKIHISGGCYAVIHGKLYKHIADMKRKGYEVIID